MLFSIVIPVYNAARYLGSCLDSILGQTFGDFELILVDDGSKDDSPAICDEYAKRDLRVVVIHKENGGANSARNRGIFAARGAYICLVDSDDRVTAKWLERVRRAIRESEAEPDIVLYNYRSIPDDGTGTEETLYIPPGYYDRKKLEEQVFPGLINSDPKGCFHPLITPAPWNKVFRKELLQAHVCQDMRIRVADDCAFTYECVLYAQSMAVCQEALYDYRAESVGSLQRSYHPDLIKNFALLFEYMKGRLAGLHPSLPAQLNGFNAEHIRIGINQEMVYHHTVSEAARHIRGQIEQSGILRYVETKGLPIKHKMRIILLRLRLYRLCMLLQKMAYDRAEE